MENRWSSEAEAVLLGGRYKIADKLGEGAAGAVYLAEDAKLKGKKWAVKEIRDPLLSQSEVDLLTRLSHPHLPGVADYFEEHGSGYLVMEYVEGETLHDRFERSGRRLPVEEILHYAIQLCDALGYLHSRKPQPVIHRDLKPSNLLIDQYGRLVLIDFGTARLYKEDGFHDTVPLGTVGFAAPEQYDLAQSDARTDLYSVGAILYYLVNRGAYPAYPTIVTFSEGDGQGEVPGRLRAIIDKLLSRDKDDRFQTADELKQELAALREEMEECRRGPGHPAVIRSREKSRLIVLLGLFPGAGATTVGLWLANRLRKRKIPHSFIEHPAIQPQLFTRMNGMNEAPGHYEFAVHRILAKRRLSDYEDWVYRGTVWYPLPPLEPAAAWNAEHQLRLLYEIHTPVALVDVSAEWDHPLVAELLEQADHTLVVARPARFRMEQAAGRMDKIREQAGRGRKVTMVANGLCPFMHDSHWLAMLAGTEVFPLPLREPRSLLEAEWRGGAAAFDRFACREEEMKAMQVLADALFPEYRRSSAKVKWGERLEKWRHRFADAFRVEGGDA